MKLTLDQTAVKLGKSARQVRYLVQQGRLRAQKIGGRWFIESDDLPTDEPGRQRRARREARLRDVTEEALGGAERARYSVRDLKAFQIALPIYRRLDEELGQEHPATCHLRTALDHLARGCHRYAGTEKSEAYRAARDAVSLAVCELVVSGGTEQETTIDTIEQELMAAMVGLLRRAERSRRNVE